MAPVNDQPPPLTSSKASVLDSESSPNVSSLNSNATGLPKSEKPTDTPVLQPDQSGTSSDSTTESTDAIHAYPKLSLLTQAIQITKISFIVALILSSSIS